MPHTDINAQLDRIVDVWSKLSLVADMAGHDEAQPDPSSTDRRHGAGPFGSLGRRVSRGELVYALASWMRCTGGLALVPCALARTPVPKRQACGQDSKARSRGRHHSALVMQAAVTSLIICPDVATFDLGIHARPRILERTFQQRRAATLYAVPTQSVHVAASEDVAAEPQQHGCARQLCFRNGRWQLQLQQSDADEEQQFDVFFNVSTPGRIGAGTTFEADVYTNVLLCTAGGGGAACAQAAASRVDVILPRDSPCVVLRAEASRVAPLLRAHLLAADRCPAQDDLRAAWPLLSADTSVQHQCAPPCEPPQGCRIVQGRKQSP